MARGTQQIISHATYCKQHTSYQHVPGTRILTLTSVVGVQIPGMVRSILDAFPMLSWRTLQSLKHGLGFQSFSPTVAHLYKAREKMVWGAQNWLIPELSRQNRFTASRSFCISPGPLADSEANPLVDNLPTPVKTMSSLQFEHLLIVAQHA